MKPASLFLVFFGLLFNASAHAERIIGLGYAPTAKGKVLDGIQFGDTSYLTATVADISKKPLGLSWMVSASTTLNKLDETNSSDLVYGYTILNAGATINISSNLFAYAGVGYSIEKGQTVRLGRRLETTDDNNQFNTTVGLGLLLGAIGATVALDSASEAISFGLVFKR